ncbi:scavenger receptor cysteine-rich type 1 protein M130 [Pempheris klunzingeri]|uniref:scavenger receptor cysteine-rich type 1 protein M130 n=1 Tax=Pempheris klunzingeri TaxID=3127111 RepID=UPI00397F5349
MMWVLLLLLYIAHTEPLISKDNKLILRNEENPCEGHVEIYRNNVLGYVGDHFWSTENEDVICKSTHCGKHDTSTDILRPIGSHVWLNEIKCNGTENHLWECQSPGWNISKARRETVKKIKCSNTVKIRLHGHKCAGAVQYSTDGQTFSGYFCAENFEPKEARLLCQSLGCGAHKEIVKGEWKAWNSNPKKMMIQCSDIGSVTNLWQCATPPGSQSCKSPASVICKGHNRLQLRGNTSNVCSGLLEDEKQTPVADRTSSPATLCQQMNCGTNVSYSEDGTNLKCTDNVSVVLMDNGKESKCYGSVYITVNGASHPVCASKWTTKEAEVVCLELGCGTIISAERKPATEGILDNVKCSGSESSLWYCRAKRDNKPFKCSSKAYVVCSGSVNSRLVDGLGKCAGKVEIHYEGRWQRVDKKEWREATSNTVCKQHNCGSWRILEKFSQGSGDFLPKTVTCLSSAKNISECTMAPTKNTNPPREKEAVGIICEEHKVVFLENACSGKVGIEQGDKTYWLSGSIETWNQKSADAVCQQMECGKADSFDTVSNSSIDTTTAVWDESYNCFSNAKSLFDCTKTTKPSDHNRTIATVTCSGNPRQLNLTNECWGTVNVCVGGKCGGVSKDTWTEQNSLKLCEELDCGTKVLLPMQQTQQSDLILKSLHSTKQTKKLDQCNVVKYGGNETSHTGSPAVVVCSGSVKAKFTSLRDKCCGNVELSYEDSWLPVCKDALDDYTTNAICEKLECGQVEEVVDYFGTTPAGPFISKVQCPKNGKKSLGECSISSAQARCSLGGIKCSGWRKLELSNACHGEVCVRSKGKRSAVSSEGWNEAHGELLCKQLQCGSLISNKTITLNSSVANTSFSCAGDGNVRNIWDCEKSTSPSKKQLYIECRDDAKATLSKKCSGEVKLNNISVCGSNWNKIYSDLVCQEQNCSNAIAYRRTSVKEDKLFRFSCDSHHYKLSQCNRYQQKCKDVVSVTCVASVELNTTEKCGGQIQIRYENNWKKVCPLTEFGREFKQKLCRELNCGDYISNVKGTYKERVSLDMQLSCSTNHMDIKHCVSLKSCQNVKPAEIYCNGYVGRGPDPPPIVAIIAGVGSLLVLVIVIVVLVRVNVVKKAKKHINASSRMFSRAEGEFESGDYEDVTSKANEMENLRRGRFRSNAEFTTENDAHSTSSLPYDDIDEAAESHPLTSQASDAGASGGSYIQEGVLDQREGTNHTQQILTCNHSCLLTDGVTYEVDDPLENYDDIEVSPEATQTKAEVHGSLQTPTESVAAAPLGVMQGEEDYLVPGHDG